MRRKSWIDAPDTPHRIIWREAGYNAAWGLRAVRRGEEFAVSENLEFADKRNS